MRSYHGQDQGATGDGSRVQISQSFSNPFHRVLQFSPTSDEQSARYKWNILERAVKFLRSLLYFSSQYVICIYTVPARNCILYHELFNTEQGLLWWLLLLLLFWVQQPFETVFQSISGRLPERGRKRRHRIEESKNVQTTTTRTYCKCNRPLPYYHPNCRTPRHWKFTQDHRTTQPPRLLWWGWYEISYHGLSTCMGDNPLAKACGLSPHTGRQTMV